MPFALLFAFAASIGIHLAALFGPDIDLAPEPEPLPIVAEIRPLPKPLPPARAAVTAKKKPAKPSPVAGKASRAKSESVAGATPVLGVPEESTAPVPEAPEPAEAAPPAADDVAAVPASEPEPRLPPHGMIRYRVDRGDDNFEIGFSRHEWEIEEGRYRLRSLAETTGLVWLFKSISIEMESVGRMDADGLRPETFTVRQDGRETRQKAVFDWDNMLVSVAEKPAQPLARGAQDLLSFNYQLGFLAHPETGGTLPIATGKKYAVYRLDVLGDEEIEVPAGNLRTLHLRAPGDNATDIWLAYDYRLLPVKIRYTDKKGDTYVQVAAEIRLDQE